jgi:hypothetical protein
MLSTAWRATKAANSSFPISDFRSPIGFLDIGFVPSRRFRVSGAGFRGPAEREAIGRYVPRKQKRGPQMDTDFHR